MLLSAFKIGQNSHPADCLGKGYGFALSWCLIRFCLFERLLILKKTIRTFQRSMEKGNLRLLAIYLLPCRAEVRAGAAEFYQDCSEGMIWLVLPSVGMGQLKYF